jgi:protein-S-isoprenylcysteine O-methyltransferase Ste14
VLFHTGIALFAVRLGQAWMAGGTLFNALVMVTVTLLVERRMTARPERAAAYRAYQASTSVWVPLPKWGPSAAAAAKKGT